MSEMITLECNICGKSFEKKLSIYKNDSKKCSAGKFCSKECFYKSPERSPNLGKKLPYRPKPKGVLSHAWKGGVIVERGYKLVECGDHPDGIVKGGGKKYIREHRLIMEKEIGRRLKSNECVHHVDGDRKNNSIDNLVLMTHSEHSKMHRKKYWNRTLCKGAGYGK
jgi:hypothetical protein